MTRKLTNLRINESKADKWLRTTLKSQLRMVWLKSQLRAEALNTGREKTDGKVYHNECRICLRWFKLAKLEIDHIHGVSKLFNLSDLPEFVRTLFCKVDDLQLLCRECHLEKTAKDMDNIR